MQYGAKSKLSSGAAAIVGIGVSNRLKRFRAAGRSVGNLTDNVIQEIFFL